VKIFNSLGSNYDFKSAFNHLFSHGSQKDYEQLRQSLSERFGGDAFLFYKGREALKQALLAADLPKDASVAINGFTCYAVDEAVTKAGLNPMYLDIDETQLHFTADTLRKIAEQDSSLKAVIVQNTLGYACDIVEIEKVCKEYDLTLIEDLAHSLGMHYPDGRLAGTVGDYVMLTFGRDKVIDAVSGGALIIRKNVSDKWLNNLQNNRHQPTARQRLVDRTYPFSTWSIRATYGIGVGKVKQVFLRKLGFLPRATDGSFDGFTDLPPSYAREINRLLKALDKNLIHRQKIATIYRSELNKKLLLNSKQVDGAVELRLPIRVDKRHKLLRFLKASGINIADIWYDAPIAPPRFMRQTAYRLGNCPASEVACGSLINLPTHININEEKARKIVGKINEFTKV